MQHFSTGYCFQRKLGFCIAAGIAYCSLFCSVPRTSIDAASTKSSILHGLLIGNSKFDESTMVPSSIAHGHIGRLNPRKDKPSPPKPKNISAQQETRNPRYCRVVIQRQQVHPRRLPTTPGDDFEGWTTRQSNPANPPNLGALEGPEGEGRGAGAFGSLHVLRPRGPGRGDVGP